MHYFATDLSWWFASIEPYIGGSSASLKSLPPTYVVLPLEEEPPRFFVLEKGFIQWYGRIATIKILTKAAECFYALACLCRLYPQSGPKGEFMSSSLHCCQIS